MAVEAESCCGRFCDCFFTTILDVINWLVFFMGLIGFFLGVYLFVKPDYFMASDIMWAGLFGGSLTMFASCLGLKYTGFRFERLGLAYFLIVLAALILELYFIERASGTSMNRMLTEDRSNLKPPKVTSTESVSVQKMFEQFNTYWHKVGCSSNDAQALIKEPCRQGQVTVTCNEDNVNQLFRDLLSVDLVPQDQDVCKACMDGWWGQFDFYTDPNELLRNDHESNKIKDFTEEDGGTAPVDSSRVDAAFCRSFPSILVFAKKHREKIVWFFIAFGATQGTLVVATLWLLCYGTPAAKRADRILRSSDQDDCDGTEISEWPAWPPKPRGTTEDDHVGRSTEALQP